MYVYGDWIVIHPGVCIIIDTLYQLSEKVIDVFARMLHLIFIWKYLGSDLWCFCILLFRFLAAEWLVKHHCLGSFWPSMLPFLTDCQHILGIYMTKLSILHFQYRHIYGHNHNVESFPDWVSFINLVQWTSLLVIDPPKIWFMKVPFLWAFIMW